MFGIAAFPGSAEPRLVERPEPAAPGPGQVLARTLELGICGTDREILESTRPWIPEGENYLILGHECLARIEALGPGIEGIAVGDLVVPVVRRAAPDAPRRVDFLPFGSYTERGIVWEHGFSTPWWLDEPRHLYRVDPSLAPWAILTEPLAVAEKGVNEALALQRGRFGGEYWSGSEAAPAPRVLVTGLGPIGFASLLAGVARGWSVSVYGRDPVDSFRAAMVSRLGGHYLPAGDLAQPPGDVEDAGFDLVLECTGSDEVVVDLARWLRSSGVMVWLGSSRRPEPATLSLARLIRDGLLRNQVFLGCVNAAPRDFRLALVHLDALRRRMPDDLAAVITARLPAREGLAPYTQRDKQGIKTVLVYE